MLLGGAVGAATGGRYVVKAHGSELEYSMRGNAELSAWGGEVLAGAAATVVGSEHIREVVRDVCGTVDRVHEIPPGVDVDLWRPAPRETALDALVAEARDDPPNPGNAQERLPDDANADRLAAFLAGDRHTVVYFGKLMENKGVHVLLDALRDLDARAVIVGFGDRRAELEAQAAGLDVLFTGPLEHRHLVHLLALADAAVVPSIFPEAFGMVAAEAAAAGCPPIVANHSGLAEIARGLEEEYPPARAGLASFPNGDVAALHERLRAVLALDGRRARRAAHRRAPRGRRALELVERRAADRRAGGLERRRAARRVGREPLGEPHRDERQHDHHERDDVDDRQLLRGRERLSRIQIGSVSVLPAVNVVTMTSSKLSAKASSAPATSAERICGNVTKRNVCHACGAEVGRRLLERGRRPPQPRDHVVVDDDDAERGVADDHRQQREVDVQRLRERRVQRHAGDDARQRDRQDDQERDRLAAEEVVSGRPRSTASVPSTSAIAVAASPAFTDVHSASRTPVLWSALENQRSVRPGGGHACTRRLVERVDRDDDQREVEERQRDGRSRRAGTTGSRAESCIRGSRRRPAAGRPAR